MSIRTKLLWLLLAIALIPLIAATIVGQLSTRSVSSDFVVATRQYLIDDTRGKLEQTVRAYASYVHRTIEALNVAVAVQAIEAREALTSPTRDPSPFALSAELDQGVNLPADYAPAEPFAEITAAGTHEPMPVSPSMQSVVAAPGVDAATLAEQGGRLASMTERYRVLRQMQSGLIYWQYTATEQGVHASYPGHGGYPEHYDPRTRPWYTFALECLQRDGFARPNWSPPIIDATSGYAMLTVSHAITASDGTPIGVTALDIRLSEILGRIDDWSESWTRDADVALIVSGITLTGFNPDDVLIFARRDADNGESSWSTPVHLKALAIEYPAHLKAIREAVMERTTRTLQTTLEGQEVLCVVSSISTPDSGTGHAAVLMAVPSASIVAMVDSAEAGFLDRMRAQLTTNLGILLIVAAAVVALALVSSRSVTRPVGALADTAQRIAGGDLDARADIHRDDELGTLARIFNDMVPRLRDGLRMSASLEMAKQVQQRLLPSTPPHRPGYDIAGLSRYCDETGGDYYDFFDTATDDHRRTGVVLGDVTGHGVAAAMLMATGRALLRSRSSEPGSLGQRLTDINRDLCRDAGDGRFMTLVALIIDPDDSVRWASAGHDPTILHDPAAQGPAAFRSLEGGGIPLGIEPSWEYQEHMEPPMPKGSVLLAGTDGIWEARNEAGEMFGKHRMCETLAAHAGKSAAEITNAILAAVDQFRGPEPQADDITMVVIKRLA